MKKYTFLLLTLILIINSCTKNDDTVTNTLSEDPIEEPIVNLVADYPTQNFMWSFMNFIYFWQEDVPDLADNRFSDLQSEEYADFLASEDNPSDFFFNICNQHENIVGEAAAVDRFSFLNENYMDVLQAFSGVSKSNGIEFGLGLFNDSNNVFGFVRYIIPGSDADGKDIKRGDLFTGINGSELTPDNFRELLFGDLDTYTINFASLENNTLSSNGKEVTFTKQEGLVESPILVNKVIEQNGLKIGYLMYNSFLASFDEELNDAIGELKAANIDELVLDLRYNGGGRVTSATQLASSIYGAKTEEIFFRERYNSKRQDEWADAVNFTDKTFDNESTINELNLSRLYVITSGNTASASELTINGLQPYIDVIQVGETTVGKNEFSFTFVDDPDSPFLFAGSENNVNPNNQYAITPLCGRLENSNGFSDYTDGLIPAYELAEDLANLGTLGDSSEPLLQLALSVIDGVTTKRNFNPIYPIKILSSSLETKSLNNTMLMGGLENNTKMGKALMAKLK